MSEVQPVSRRDVDVRVVNELLRKLGAQSVEEIVAFLRKEGISGYRFSSYSCPVANFVTLRTRRNISIGGTWCLESERASGSERRPVPSSVRSFIAAFDNGDYPDLDASDDDMEY